MSKNNTTVGIGFLDLLTILFIGLKVANIIQWSWWWVLSPILIPTAIVLIGFILIAILNNINK